MLLADAKALQPLVLVFSIGTAVVVFMIGLSISAFILKTACRTAGVAVPDTGRAMVVSFLEGIAGTVSYVCSAITISFVGLATQVDKASLLLTAGFSAVTVAFVVPAGLYVPMLRVTFQKGLVIALLRYLITIAICAGLAFVILALSGKHR